jgi:hypothetical protein
VKAVKWQSDDAGIIEPTMAGKDCGHERGLAGTGRPGDANDNAMVHVGGGSSESAGTVYEFGNGNGSGSGHESRRYGSCQLATEAENESDPSNSSNDKSSY